MLLCGPFPHAEHESCLFYPSDGFEVTQPGRSDTMGNYIVSIGKIVMGNMSFCMPTLFGGRSLDRKCSVLVRTTDGSFCRKLSWYPYQVIFLSCTVQYLVHISTCISFFLGFEPRVLYGRQVELVREVRKFAN